jgi:outer membrane protein TolC
MPHINFFGQASYQSDVFSFPSNPVFETPIIPKDQFRVQLDLVQQIYDGGRSKNLRKAETARVQSEQESILVNLYSIKGHINQLYFGAMIYQENLQILRTLRRDLIEQEKVIRSGVHNGVLMPSVLDNFKKQILITDQEILSADIEREALLEMLSKWIEEAIDPDTELQPPPASLPVDELTIRRPEISFLQSQHDYLEAMKNVSTVTRHPNISAFAQGGFGRPNPLNWLENEVADFYMVGVRMNWNIFDYGNAKREREIHSANQLIIASELERFEDQVETQMIQEKSDISKLERLIAKDTELLHLQQNIVERSFSQLNNGVITATDYLSELNEKTKLEINKKIREIQLIQSHYDRMNTSGNL